MLNSFLTLVFSLAIIIARRPEAFTLPQFWAEDGIYWYGQAYNLGWLQASIIPITGYYQTISRIGGALAQLLPLRLAPLLFNSIALVIMAIPTLFFISDQIKIIIKPKLFRYLLLALYLTLPNNAETYLNLTNSQWYLALTALLALFFLNDKYFWLKLSLFILMGLSGPLSILMIPIVILHYWGKFDQKRIWLTLSICLTGATQLFTLLLSRGRPLGVGAQFSPLLVFNIFTKQIVWGALVGPNGYAWFSDKIPLFQIFFPIVGCLGAVVIIYGFLFGPKTIKLMLLFATLIFFSSLFLPIVGTTDGLAPLEFLYREWNTRYWMIPMVIFLITLIWIVSTKNTSQIVKAISASLLLVAVLFQIKNYRHYHNFRYPAYQDLNFEKYAQKFENMESGSELTIPVNPPTDQWKMKLVKH